MKFVIGTPKYSCIKDIEGFGSFLEHGQPELQKFLKNFLNLEEIRVQCSHLDVIKGWLNVKSLNSVNEIKERENEICVVSQIYVDDELIAYYPYVLVGKYIKKMNLAKNFFPRIAEAISEQLTACYLQKFKGGDWLFGDKFAQMLIANCVSSNLHNGIKFAHLIEKIEQLSVSTFEGEYFSTGVIVSSNFAKYRESNFKFCEKRSIDTMNKREWFLADGRTSFFLIDINSNIEGIYVNESMDGNNFVDNYFEKYYLYPNLHDPDFIVRAIGANEISVSDAYGKEYVKIENVWRFRYKNNFAEYLEDSLDIKKEICNAIIYYTLKCSRNHISTIIWIPKKCDKDSIKDYITGNGISLWETKLNILKRSNEVLIDKILASDGAIVIEKNGDIMYESVFVDVGKAKVSLNTLVGTGETATAYLAQNGVAIKVSQDGTIKIYSGNDKFYL